MHFNIAIVGAGSMGREHAKAFARLPGVKVAGIASRTKARAEALASELGIPVVAESIAQLHERTHADLVVVAVPELEANGVAKAAFALPWAVLLEKPAGYDLSDAEDIARAAKGRKAPVMVGLNRRFYSSSQAIRADVDQRADEPRFVHVQDQQSYAEARRHNHPEKVVERFMYANSIHIIDLIAFFARGEVAKVQRITPWRGAHTTVMLAHVEFSSGDTALYEGLWQGPGPWAAAVATPSRRWTMQPLEQAQFQNANERKRNDIEIAEDDRICKAGFLAQARGAIARVRGEPSPIPDLAESLRTMRLIHDIFGV